MSDIDHPREFIACDATRPVHPAGSSCLFRKSRRFVGTGWLIQRGAEWRIEPLGASLQPEGLPPAHDFVGVAAGLADRLEVARSGSLVTFEADVTATSARMGRAIEIRPAGGRVVPQRPIPKWSEAEKDAAGLAVDRIPDSWNVYEVTTGEIDPGVWCVTVYTAVPVTGIAAWRRDLPRELLRVVSWLQPAP